MDNCSGLTVPSGLAHPSIQRGGGLRELPAGLHEVCAQHHWQHILRLLRATPRLLPYLPGRHNGRPAVAGSGLWTDHPGYLVLVHGSGDLIVYCYHTISILLAESVS